MICTLKISQNVEMVSNLQLNFFDLKVRHRGSRSSILVRTLRSFTRTLPAKRPLRQLSRGTPLNKFGLEGSPPGVVDAQRPFQRIEFKLAQVFFGEIAESTDRLLFDMALFDGARPDPREPLQFEQLLR